jgi:hypothetical protein
MAPKSGYFGTSASPISPLMSHWNHTSFFGTWFRANRTKYLWSHRCSSNIFRSNRCSSPCLRSISLFHYFFGTILTWFRGSDGSKKRQWNVVPNPQNHINGTTFFIIFCSSPKCGTNRLEMGASLGEVPPPFLEHPLGGANPCYIPTQRIGSTVVRIVVPTTLLWNQRI